MSTAFKLPLEESQNPESSWDVFPRSVELWFLWMPYLVAGLFLIPYLLNPVDFKDQSKMIRLLVDIFLLDTTHTVLSWPLLMLPEVKEWKKEYNLKHNFGRRISAVAAGLFLTFMAGNIYFKWDQKTFHVFSMILFSVLPAHHTLSQMKGLSLTMTVAWLKNRFQENIPVLEKIRWRENAGFWIFLVGVVLWRATIFKVIPQAHTAWLYPVCQVLMAVGLILILSTLTALQKQYRKKKAAFYGRLALLPAGLVTLWGSFSVQAIHGIEYGFITHQIVTNSKASQTEKKKIFILMYILMGVVSILAASLVIKQWLYPYLTIPGWVVSTLLLIRVVNTYTHYWFDGVLFRMKDPASRRFIAPLLVRQKENP